MPPAAVRLDCDRARIRDPARLYYGKSFIYPLFAAPFVRLFGTNGFLRPARPAAGARCCAAATCSCTRGCGRRSRPLLASAFVIAIGRAGLLRLDHAGAVQLRARRCSAYFCWLFKEVAAPRAAPRGAALAVRAGSDVRRRASCSASRRSRSRRTLLLFLPILVWHALAAAVAPRRSRRGLVFGAVAGGLFGVNIAISGDWNYQGGERSTFYCGVPVPDADVGLRRRRAKGARRGADRRHLRPARVLDRTSRTTSAYYVRRPLLGPRAVLLPGGLRARRVPRARRDAGQAGSGSCSPRGLRADRCSSSSTCRTPGSAAAGRSATATS